MHHTEKFIMKAFKKIDNGKSYDAVCDEWHEYRSAAPVNTCIVDFAEHIAPHGNVLDVGCGTGYPIAQFLSARGFSVTGIDISQKMIDKANSLKLENAVFSKKSIEEFTSDILFDGVIAFDSIWHVEKSALPDTYRKIASLMKRGAYFIFTGGNRDGETVGTMFGEEFYYGALDIDELKSVFSNAGMEIISLTEHYKEQTTGERDLLVVAKKI